MRKWEYKVCGVVDIDIDRPIMLNEMGERGWELVNVVGNNFLLFFFKREKREPESASYFDQKEH